MNLKRIMLIALVSVTSCFTYATQEREQLSPDVMMSMHTSIINPIKPHLVFPNKQQGQLWLTDMSNRLKKWIPDDFLRNRYLTIIQYEAARASLDPQMILSVITVESRFNKYALSNVGARGMMQVMPFWVDAIGSKSQDLFDLQTNIRYGCTILRYYLQQENGNLMRALARYNGSLGSNKYPDKVMAAYNRYWQPYTVITMDNNKVKYVNYSLK